MKEAGFGVSSKLLLPIAISTISLLSNVANAQLEEVVVTATKRAESLQDVSVAVTAITGDDLRELNLSEPRDLFKLIPNVSVQTNSSAGQLQLSMRGVGFSTFSPLGVQPVMVFQDEVVLNSPQVAGLFLFDAERIEVLRGPQNTLYGRNTTGGAINYVTRKPEVGGEANGYLDLTVGSFGQRDIVGAYGASLGDEAAFRIAVQNQHLDGYWDNLNFPGDQLGERDSTMIRAQLAYEPAERLSMLFNLHGGGSYGSPRAVKFLGLTEPGSSNGIGGAPCTLPFDFDDLKTNCVGRDGSENNSDNTEAYGNVENDVDDIEAAGGSFRLDYEGDNFSFMSLTAYEENDYDHWESNDGFGDLALFQFRQISSAEQWTQEFRLTSSGDGPMQWIAGGFALIEDAEITSMLFLPVFQEGEIGNTTQDTEMFSPYGQIEYDLSDALTLTVGARYVYESKEVAGQAYNAVGITTSPENPGLFTFSALRPFTDDAGVAFDSGDESWSMWGGEIGLDYKFEDGSLLYGQITRGEKAGQYSDSASTIRQGTMSTPVDPESVLAYELGYKTTLMDGKLQANLAIFFNDYQDQQLQITTDGGTISRFINAAESETYGAEFEAQFAPSPGWFANLAVGWLQTEITDTDFPEDASDTIEIGRELTNAPEWTANLGVDRMIDIGGGELTLHADVVYTSSRNFNLIDTAESRIFNTDPSFILFNAQAQYRFGKDNSFRLTAWGKNLTDEIYFNKVESFGPPTGIQQTNLIYMGTPRTYGVTFGVDF